MAPLRIGFLGYEQANALDLVGPAEAFAVRATRLPVLGYDNGFSLRLVTTPRQSTTM